MRKLLYIAAFVLGMTSCTKEYHTYDTIPEHEHTALISFESEGLKQKTGSLSGKVTDPENFIHTYTSNIDVRIRNADGAVVFSATAELNGTQGGDVSDVISAGLGTATIPYGTYKLELRASDLNPTISANSGLTINNNGVRIDGSSVTPTSLNGSFLVYDLSVSSSSFSVNIGLLPDSNLYTFDWSITGPRASEFELFEFRADWTTPTSTTGTEFIVQNGVELIDYFYATSGIALIDISAVVRETADTTNSYTLTADQVQNNSGSLGSHRHYNLGFTANNQEADGGFSGSVTDFGAPQDNPLTGSGN